MIHQHPCPRCGWRWTCTCQDPDQHHGFCFECADKTQSPIHGVTTPPSPLPPPDETYPGWFNVKS
jgi:hypothetical protein